MKTEVLSGPDALRSSREARRRHQEENAGNRDRWVHANGYYYQRL